MSIVYNGKIAGVTFEPARSNLRKLVKMLQHFTQSNEDFKLRAFLRHNPENPYDCNAIEVHAGVDDAMLFIGHIPKTDNVKLLEIGLDNVEVEVEKFNALDETIKGANIIVRSKLEESPADSLGDMDCD